MLDQVLWIDCLIKLAAGLPLLVAPDTLALVLGLPRLGTGFYARVLGALLVGVATAILAEGFGRQGLGATGAALVNFAGASVLASQLAFAGASLSRRGRWPVRGGAILLGILGLAELLLA